MTTTMTSNSDTDHNKHEIDQQQQRTSSHDTMTTSSESEESSSEDTSSPKQCRLYLAPSTIPGAGYGIFAGSEGFNVGDMVSYGDIVVPLTWISDSIHSIYDYYSEELLTNFLWDEYSWSAISFYHMNQEGGLESDDKIKITVKDGADATFDDDESDDVEDGDTDTTTSTQERTTTTTLEVTVSGASPGFGAAINCWIPLVNVEEPDTNHDLITKLSNAKLTSSSPGVGAFTPYYNRRFQAITDIPSGMELFTSYGETYFESRVEIYGIIPITEHYEQADTLFNIFSYLKWNKCKKITKATTNVLLSSEMAASNTDDDDDTDDGQQEEQQQEQRTTIQDVESPTSIVRRLKVCDIIYDSVWKLMQDMKDIWNETSAALMALPNDLNYTETLIHEYGHNTSYQHYNRSIKSLDWLEQHGTCMDNIRDGISTIPHAGRGAFATRPITKGTILAPAPLIHISNSTILTIPRIPIHVGGEDEGESDAQQSPPPPPRYVVGQKQQLILNYCFGHAESTLLLCPYGVLTWLINHSYDNANTKIVWSNDESQRHLEWFDMPISKWGTTMHNGLSLEYVATRDIQEGEEITINYGIEWDTSWKQHVHNFYYNRSMEERRDHYIPAFELNEFLLDNTLEQVIHYYDDDIGSSNNNSIGRQELKEGQQQQFDNKLLADRQLLLHQQRKFCELDSVILKIRYEYIGLGGYYYHDDSRADDNGEVSDGGLECRIILYPTISQSQSVDDDDANERYVVQVIWPESGAAGRYYYDNNTGEQLVIDLNTETSTGGEGDAITTTSVVVRDGPILFDVPRDAFYFVDEPFTRDHMQSWAFRHPMMIPDDMFPSIWRNLVNDDDGDVVDLDDDDDRGEEEGGENNGKDEL